MSSLQAGQEELGALRAAVRQVVGRFGHDYYVRTSREAGNACELWNELGSVGALGVAIPEKYGGGGQGIGALAVVAEEIAAAGCPLMLVALSPAVCATMLTQYGSDAQRSEWLPGLADGSRVIGFAITEPDAGSNARNIKTNAVYDNGEWVISGEKYYVSHVDNADALIVIANISEGTESRPGLAAFVVPTSAPGLSATEIEVEITSPERQYSVFFDGVHVSSDAILDGEHGTQVLFAGLNPERVLSAALLNGIARYAIDLGARYARERSVWGQPIGAHQAIAHPLAQAEVALAGARLLTQSAVEAYDRGEGSGVPAAMAKLAASECASSALDTSIQIHGGNGMSREFGLMTLSGLVRLFRIAPVSSEMLLNHIAHKALSLPRSYG